MTQRSDLVERIRARPNDAPMPTEHLLDEAADEIERLRGLLSEAINFIPTGDERGNPFERELDFIARAVRAVEQTAQISEQR